MIPIFIGYDPKEAIAYHTCVNSIIRTASKPISVIPLSLNLLDGYTETHIDGSNTFTYTRFLVPTLMDYKGWAIFIDGDMLLREDINKLWELRDESKAVMVVKHDYETRTNSKYLKARNNNYPRKNWSSVILWNCGHAGNRNITTERVQQSTGDFLHRFSWLDDQQIGELPKEWNWLDVEYEWNPLAKLVHYTLGTPCFREFADKGDFADEWHKERILTNHADQIQM